MRPASLLWTGILLVLVTFLFLRVPEHGGRVDRIEEIPGERAATGAQSPALRGVEPDSGIGGGGVLRLAPFEPEHLLVTHPPRKGAPLRFAEAVRVALTPEDAGQWALQDGVARWSFRIEAPGSRNLNLGFSRFRLPKSARLELRVGGELMVRPFTEDDNEDHGELWTPVVAGAELDLVLEVAEDERSGVELELASVNRGFRDLSFAAGYWKIGNSAPSGDCYIDVVCSAEQSGVGPALEQYRDQIKAAGVYTLEGEDTCSGSALNNVRKDGTPFFITADHCGVTSGNAASMVVYWNHENATCRTPGTNENGGNGNGPVTDFNSGAILRAAYSPSDMALVELDDPIDPSHDVYLAGWSRSGTPGMAVGIHFPNTSEKRISFDFDSLRSTDDNQSGSNANGTHWMVVDWDHGSTEGGSSGSPIYDENGRMVGQLTGGFAACGNDESDWYGKFSEGWEGGGSPSSRMRDWLDPDETGALALDGMTSGLSQVTIADAELLEGDSGTTTLEFTVILSEAVDERIDLTYSTQSGSALAGSDFAEASGVPFFIAAGQLSESFSIVINGDTNPEENESFEVSIALVGDSPVVIGSGVARGTITNDDFVTPVLLGPSLVQGRVAENVSVAMAVQNTPTEFSLSAAPAGMQIDGNGVISWVPPAAGEFEVTVTIANEAGSAAGSVIFEITPNSLAAAVDSPGGISLTTGGQSPFTNRESADSLEGGNRVQSGVISDESESWLEAVVEGPDYVGFWWKVSSEEGFDFLTLSVDGESRGGISGSRDWEYRVIAIPPGEHTLRWTYSKDLSESDGEDAGWIDSLQLASRSTPFLMGPAHVRVPEGGPVDYQFPVAGPGATFTPVSLGEGLSLNAVGEVVGTPQVTGERSFTLTVVQEDQSLSIPATVEVMADAEGGTAAYGEWQPDGAQPWGVSGSGTWISQESVTHDGTAAAAAQGVPHDGRASLSTWVHGPGKVSFWWRVSSERDYDFLHFELNGQIRDSMSGNSGWQEHVEELPYGWNELTWAYEKDESDSRRNDTGYIDGLSFSGYAGWALRAGIGQRMGVTLDPDFDGQNLLLEYATGGSATEWDEMPSVSLVDGSLQMEVSKPAEAGLLYDGEVSGNLADWNRVERTVLRDDDEVFRVRDQQGVETAERRFLRMTVHPQR